MNLRRSTHRQRLLITLVSGVLVSTLFAGSAFGSTPATSITTRNGLISISGSDSYILDFSADPTQADFSGIDSSGSVSYSSSTFSGTLDGNGLTLTGLSVALFDSLGDGAAIKNLGFTTAPYTPAIGETPASGGITTSGSVSNSVGVLANRATGDLFIENVQVSGGINSSSQYVGGLVGSVSGNIEVINADLNLDVSGTYMVGGIVGSVANDIKVDGSTLTGNISNPVGWAGGIVALAGSGDSSKVEISNTTINGDVHASFASAGVVALNYGEIYILNTSVSANVTSDSNSAGGIVGVANSGSVTIEGSSHSGEVTGKSCSGGLVGCAYREVTISNSSQSGSVTGEESVGGLVGLSVGAAVVTNSNSSSNIVSGNFSGGLIGQATSTVDVSNSSRVGTIFSSGSSVGGLVGLGYDTINISSSSNVGSISSGRLVDNGSHSDPTSWVDQSSAGWYCGLYNDYLCLIATGYYANTILNPSTLVYEDSVGGLVGNSVYALNIQDSFSVGQINGGNATGGLVGNSAGSAIISNSYSGGTVSTQYSIYDGHFDLSTRIDTSYPSTCVDQSWFVYSCLSTDTHYTSWIHDYTTSHKNNVGGLVGSSSGAISINNSIALGNIIGGGNVGGLVGNSSGSTTIDHSFALGHVTGSGDNIGGLAGSANNLCLSNSSAAGDTSGSSIVGGLVGTFVSNCLTNNVSSFGNVMASDHGGGSLVGVMWAGAFNDFFVGSNVTVSDAAASEPINPQATLFACDCRDSRVTAPYLESGFAATEIGNPLTSQSEPTIAQAFVRAFGESLSETYDPTKTWNVCGSVNDGLPYLTSSFETDPCYTDQTDDGGGDSGGGDSGGNESPYSSGELKFLSEIKDFAEIVSSIASAEKPLSIAILEKLTSNIKVKVDNLPTDVKSWITKMEYKSSVELLTTFNNPSSQAISIILNDQLREFIGVDNFREIFASGEKLDIETLNKIFIEKFGYSLDDWLTGIGIPFLMYQMLA